MKRAIRGLAATAALIAALTPAFASDGSTPVAAGPDVTVFTLSGVGNYGGSGGFHGYSVGTVSCNRGTTPLNWCDQASGCAPGATPHDHPVIAQNMYRLKNGRFEQIGMSWLKHGFVSTNSTTAGCTGAAGGSCQAPPAGGNQLGVGCTDPYGSGLNGSRPLGMRSEVNSTTGAYPFPYTNVGSTAAFDQRVKVADVDLDPALNAGALYWVEGQYVAPDDALAGNGLNNASYRSVTVGAAPTLTVTATGSTVEAKSALHAWKAADASVEIFNADFCSAPVERFEVARKVTEIVGDTTWHYEYAVRNMNSDHAGGAFLVRFPAGTGIRDGGARMTDHHSGEPYTTNPWEMTVDDTESFIRWESEPIDEEMDANALRWATTFSFWFDADAPPADAIHEIETFKPTGSVTANAGSDAQLCPGDSVQLGEPPVAGLTYLWSPGGQTTAQITVSPASTTVYTLTVSNGCAQDDDTVTVTVDSAPAAPALASPANGASGLLNPVTLAWNAAAGATTYAFQVATDSGFSDVVAGDETADLGAVLDPLDAGIYFWRTRALSGCPGPYSSVFDFTIDDFIFIDGFESGDTSGGWTTN